MADDVDLVHCPKCEKAQTQRSIGCLGCGWRLVALHGARRREKKGRWNRSIVETFPFVRFFTVGNGTPGINEVRAEHAVLHGLVAPYWDDVWRWFEPPTDRRCRCFTVMLTRGQVIAEPMRIVSLIGARDGSPVFRDMSVELAVAMADAKEAQRKRHR